MFLAATVTLVGWIEFVHLATALLKEEESARGNHVLACNFAKYSPIKKIFTDTVSNKPFTTWLLTAPPNLRYIATLPCSLSRFLTLMFHKVVWQHMQGVVGLWLPRTGISSGTPEPYARQSSTGYLLVGLLMNQFTAN